MRNQKPSTRAFGHALAVDLDGRIYKTDAAGRPMRNLDGQLKPFDTKIECYYAQFANIGDRPEYVTDENDNRRAFDNHQQAMYEALVAMRNAINARAKWQRPAGDASGLTGADLATRLHNAGIEAVDACRMWTISPKRMQMWLTGEAEIPRWLEILSRQLRTNVG